MFVRCWTRWWRFVSRIRQSGSLQLCLVSSFSINHRRRPISSISGLLPSFPSGFSFRWLSEGIIYRWIGRNSTSQSVHRQRCHVHSLLNLTWYHRPYCLPFEYHHFHTSPISSTCHFSVAGPSSSLLLWIHGSCRFSLRLFVSGYG